MKTKRRRYEPEFKARVTLEALKGITTLQQIARDFDIHLDEGRILIFGYT